MHIRPADANDATGISVVLQSLTAAGLRTRPDSVAFALDHYIAPADLILCSVAEAGDTILGLQVLKRAQAGNRYDVPPGWGIIGTHISPDQARRGIGAALFAVTLNAARDAGLAHIDAHIGRTNAGGRAYYDAMGFRTYRETDTSICKCFSLPA